MNKTVLFAAGTGFLIVATAAGIAAAQPPEGQRAGRDVTRQDVIQRIDQTFARLDANRDGRVTPDERRADRERRRAEMADRMFDRLDADHNGSISREEMRGGRMRGPRRGMRMAGPGAGSEGRDGDGRRGSGMRGPRGMGARETTREEMRERALARFDRMDANHDGTLTLDERRQAREAMRERMRMRREQNS